MADDRRRLEIYKWAEQIAKDLERNKKDLVLRRFLATPKGDLTPKEYERIHQLIVRYGDNPTLFRTALKMEFGIPTGTVEMLKKRAADIIGVLKDIGSYAKATASMLWDYATKQLPEEVARLFGKGYSVRGDALRIIANPQRLQRDISFRSHYQSWMTPSMSHYKPLGSGQALANLFSDYRELGVLDDNDMQAIAKFYDDYKAKHGTEPSSAQISKFVSQVLVPKASKFRQRMQKVFENEEEAFKDAEMAKLVSEAIGSRFTLEKSDAWLLAEQIRREPNKVDEILKKWNLPKELEQKIRSEVHKMQAEAARRGIVPETLHYWWAIRKPYDEAIVTGLHSGIPSEEDARILSSAWMSTREEALLDILSFAIPLDLGLLGKAVAGRAGKIAKFLPKAPKVTSAMREFAVHVGEQLAKRQGAVRFGRSVRNVGKVSLPFVMHGVNLGIIPAGAVLVASASSDKDTSTADAASEAAKFLAGSVLLALGVGGLSKGFIHGLRHPSVTKILKSVATAADIDEYYSNKVRQMANKLFLSEWAEWRPKQTTFELKRPETGETVVVPMRKAVYRNQSAVYTFEETTPTTRFKAFTKSQIAVDLGVFKGRNIADIEEQVLPQIVDVLERHGFTKQDVSPMLVLNSEADGYRVALLVPTRKEVSANKSLVTDLARIGNVGSVEDSIIDAGVHVQSEGKGISFTLIRRGTNPRSLLNYRGHIGNLEHYSDVASGFKRLGFEPYIRFDPQGDAQKILDMVRNMSDEEWYRMDSHLSDLGYTAQDLENVLSKVVSGEELTKDEEAVLRTIDFDRSIKENRVVLRGASDRWTFGISHPDELYAIGRLAELHADFVVGKWSQEHEEELKKLAPYFVGEKIQEWAEDLIDLAKESKFLLDETKNPKFHAAEMLAEAVSSLSEQELFDLFSASGDEKAFKALISGIPDLRDRVRQVFQSSYDNLVETFDAVLASDDPETARQLFKQAASEFDKFHRMFGFETWGETAKFLLDDKDKVKQLMGKINEIREQLYNKGILSDEDVPASIRERWKLLRDEPQISKSVAEFTANPESNGSAFINAMRMFKPDTTVYKNVWSKLRLPVGDNAENIPMFFAQRIAQNRQAAFFFPLFPHSVASAELVDMVRWSMPLWLRGIFAQVVDIDGYHGVIEINGKPVWVTATDEETFNKVKEILRSEDFLDDQAKWRELGDLMGVDPDFIPYYYFLVQTENIADALNQAIRFELEGRDWNSMDTGKPPMTFGEVLELTGNDMEVFLSGKPPVDYGYAQAHKFIGRRLLNIDFMNDNEELTDYKVGILLPAIKDIDPSGYSYNVVEALNDILLGREIAKGTPVYTYAKSFRHLAGYQFVQLKSPKGNPLPIYMFVHRDFLEETMKFPEVFAQLPDHIKGEIQSVWQGAPSYLEDTALTTPAKRHIAAFHLLMQGNGIHNQNSSDVMAKAFATLMRPQVSPVNLAYHFSEMFVRDIQSEVARSFPTMLFLHTQKSNPPVLRISLTLTRFKDALSYIPLSEWSKWGIGTVIDKPQPHKRQGVPIPMAEFYDQTFNWWRSFWTKLANKDESEVAAIADKIVDAASTKQPNLAKYKEDFRNLVVGIHRLLKSGVVDAKVLGDLTGMVEGIWNASGKDASKFIDLFALYMASYDVAKKTWNNTFYGQGTNKLPISAILSPDFISSLHEDGVVLKRLAAVLDPYTAGWAEAKAASEWKSLATLFDLTEKEASVFYENRQLLGYVFGRWLSQAKEITDIGDALKKYFAAAREFAESERSNFWVWLDEVVRLSLRGDELQSFLSAVSKIQDYFEEDKGLTVLAALSASMSAYSFDTPMTAYLMARKFLELNPQIVDNAVNSLVDFARKVGTPLFNITGREGLVDGLRKMVTERFAWAMAATMLVPRALPNIETFNQTVMRNLLTATSDILMQFASEFGNTPYGKKLRNIAENIFETKPTTKIEQKMLADIERLLHLGREASRMRRAFMRLIRGRRIRRVWEKAVSGAITDTDLDELNAAIREMASAKLRRHLIIGRYARRQRKLFEMSNAELRRLIRFYSRSELTDRIGGEDKDFVFEVPTIKETTIGKIRNIKVLGDTLVHNFGVDETEIRGVVDELNRRAKSLFGDDFPELTEESFKALQRFWEDYERIVNEIKLVEEGEFYTGELIGYAEQPIFKEWFADFIPADKELTNERASQIQQRFIREYAGRITSYERQNFFDELRPEDKVAYLAWRSFLAVSDFLDQQYDAFMTYVIGQERGYGGDIRALENAAIRASSLFGNAMASMFIDILMGSVDGMEFKFLSKLPVDNWLILDMAYPQLGEVVSKSYRLFDELALRVHDEALENKRLVDETLSEVLGERTINPEDMHPDDWEKVFQQFHDLDVEVMGYRSPEDVMDISQHWGNDRWYMTIKTIQTLKEEYSMSPQLAFLRTVADRMSSHVRPIIANIGAFLFSLPEQLSFKFVDSLLKAYSDGNLMEFSRQAVIAAKHFRATAKFIDRNINFLLQYSVIRDTMGLSKNFKVTVDIIRSDLKGISDMLNDIAGMLESRDPKAIERAIRQMKDLNTMVLVSSISQRLMSLGNALVKRFGEPSGTLYGFVPIPLLTAANPFALAVIGATAGYFLAKAAFQLMNKFNITRSLVQKVSEHFWRSATKSYIGLAQILKNVTKQLPEIHKNLPLMKTLEIYGSEIVELRLAHSRKENEIAATINRYRDLVPANVAAKMSQPYIPDFSKVVDAFFGINAWGQNKDKLLMTLWQRYGYSPNWKERLGREIWSKLSDFVDPQDRKAAIDELAQVIGSVLGLDQQQQDELKKHIRVVSKWDALVEMFEGLDKANLVIQEMHELIANTNQLVNLMSERDRIVRNLMEKLKDRARVMRSVMGQSGLALEAWDSWVTNINMLMRYETLVDAKKFNARKRELQEQLSTNKQALNSHIQKLLVELTNPTHPNYTQGYTQAVQLASLVFQITNDLLQSFINTATRNDEQWNAVEVSLVNAQRQFIKPTGFLFRDKLQFVLDPNDYGTVMNIISSLDKLNLGHTEISPDIAFSVLADMDNAAQVVGFMGNLRGFVEANKGTGLFDQVLSKYGINDDEFIKRIDEAIKAVRSFSSTMNAMFSPDDDAIMATDGWVTKLNKVERFKIRVRDLENDLVNDDAVRYRLFLEAQAMRDELIERYGWQAKSNDPKDEGYWELEPPKELSHFINKLNNFFLGEGGAIDKFRKFFATNIAFAESAGMFEPLFNPMPTILKIAAFVAGGYPYQAKEAALGAELTGILSIRNQIAEVMVTPFLATLNRLLDRDAKFEAKALQTIPVLTAQQRLQKIMAEAENKGLGLLQFVESQLDDRWTGMVRQEKAEEVTGLLLSHVFQAYGTNDYTRLNEFIDELARRNIIKDKQLFVDVFNNNYLGLFEEWLSVVGEETLNWVNTARVIHGLPPLQGEARWFPRYSVNLATKFREFFAKNFDEHLRIVEMSILDSNFHDFDVIPEHRRMASEHAYLGKGVVSWQTAFNDIVNALYAAARQMSYADVWLWANHMTTVWDRARQVPINATTDFMTDILSHHLKNYLNFLIFGNMVDFLGELPIRRFHANLKARLGITERSIAAMQESSIWTAPSLVSLAKWFTYIRAFFLNLGIALRQLESPVKGTMVTGMLKDMLPVHNVSGSKLASLSMKNFLKACMLVMVDPTITDKVSMYSDNIRTRMARGALLLTHHYSFEPSQVRFNITDDIQRVIERYAGMDEDQFLDELANGRWVQVASQVGKKVSNVLRGGTSHIEYTDSAVTTISWLTNFLTYLDLAASQTKGHLSESHFYNAIKFAEAGTALTQGHYGRVGRNIGFIRYPLIGTLWIFRNYKLWNWYGMVAPILSEFAERLSKKDLKKFTDIAYPIAAGFVAWWLYNWAWQDTFGFSPSDPPQSLEFVREIAKTHNVPYVDVLLGFTAEMFTPPVYDVLMTMLVMNKPWSVIEPVTMVGNIAYTAVSQVGEPDYYKRLNRLFGNFFDRYGARLVGATLGTSLMRLIQDFQEVSKGSKRRSKFEHFLRVVMGLRQQSPSYYYVKHFNDNQLAGRDKIMLFVRAMKDLDKNPYYIGKFFIDAKSREVATFFNAYKRDFPNINPEFINKNRQYLPLASTLDQVAMVAESVAMKNGIPSEEDIFNIKMLLQQDKAFKKLCEGIAKYWTGDATDENTLTDAALYVGWKIIHGQYLKQVEAQERKETAKKTLEKTYGGAFLQ